MTVTIDQSAGFCWGVVRTIDIAEEQMRESPELYSLGPVIHNPMEIERLRARGLETVTHGDFERLTGKTVLIRAHGEPPSTYALARTHGVTLIDATCPVVTKVQERIRKFYDQGYQIVIFGKKDHAEVIGLVGHVNNEAVVVRSVEEAAAVDASRKTVLFSQTTMDKATFYAIADVLRGRIRDFVVGTFEESAIDFHAKDTICGQVSGRDKKLREFAAAERRDGVRGGEEFLERQGVVRDLRRREPAHAFHRRGIGAPARVVRRGRHGRHQRRDLHAAVADGTGPRRNRSTVTVIT